MGGALRLRKLLKFDSPSFARVAISVSRFRGNREGQSCLRPFRLTEESTVRPGRGLLGTKTAVPFAEYSSKTENSGSVLKYTCEYKNASHADSG
jgi:hypothetical protein